MKPISVKVTAREVTATFDNGQDLLLVSLADGEQEFALDYLKGVFEIDAFVKTNGVTYVGTVGVDQSLENWAIAMNAYRNNAETNDAAIQYEETGISEEQVNRAQVQYRVASALAGIFEELANGN